MRSPLPWLGALLGLYLTVPLVAFLVRLGRGREQLQSTPGLTDAIVVSVQTATISTLIIAVLGLPLAYVLSRGRGRTSGVVGILLQLPLAFPPLVSGLLLLYLVGPYTPLGDFFGGQLTDNRVGIVLAQLFVSAPFAVIAARSAFTALDPGWEDVAATLGHGRLARFLRVALPAAAPGIGAGLLLSWLRAFGEFGATVLLAYQPHSIPVLTYIQFGSTGLTGTTGPVVATLLISLVVVAGAPLLARVRWPVSAPVEPVPPADLPAGAPGPIVRLDLDSRLGSFHLRARYEPAGRHVAVIGPSGSGKTMTLRLLAGLLPPGSGRVDFDSVDVTGVAAEHRGVGYVPQEPTLLPHLRLWQQVTFAVDADPRRAAYWLHRLGLAGLERRFPHELSGGQRRRVAIVRALAHAPRLLLLDEPSSGLDTVIRDELRRELRALQRDTGLTTVLVTHDPAEAILLAGELIVLEAGQVLQAGPIRGVLTRPASAAVARLIGIRNVHEGQLRSGTLQVGTLEIAVGGRADAVSWCIRPELVDLTDGTDATVLDVVDYGPYREVQLDWAGTALVAHTEREIRVGAPIGVRIDPGAVIVWPGAVPSPAG